ncbi:MAG: hypothetical protein HOE76_03555 [Euryarchaeota archaeon]|nr:hypothetical protein [Euryarchaeota archaeon]
MIFRDINRSPVYSIVTACIGGGQGIAMVIESL